jgi:hypothetical protein
MVAQMTMNGTVDPPCAAAKHAPLLPFPRTANPHAPRFQNSRSLFPIYMLCDIQTIGALVPQPTAVVYSPHMAPKKTSLKEIAEMLAHVDAFTEFPVSEAVILAAARKLGIGRKFGRTILFSSADRQRLYEDSPYLSDSSAAPSRPTGTSAASALKRARKLLTTDARSAKGAPKRSGRSAKSRS